MMGTCMMITKRFSEVYSEYHIRENVNSRESYIVHSELTIADVSTLVVTRASQRN